LLHLLVWLDIEYRVTVLSVRDGRSRSGPPPTPGVVELDLDDVE